jgi:hypothetical protein
MAAAIRRKSASPIWNSPLRKTNPQRRLSGMKSSASMSGSIGASSATSGTTCRRHGWKSGRSSTWNGSSSTTRASAVKRRSSSPSGYEVRGE